MLSFIATYPDFKDTVYIDIFKYASPPGSKCSLHFLSTGQFQVGNWQQCIDLGDMLMDIKQYTDAYKHFQFVRAFIKILKTQPNYDHKHFISQLSKKRHISGGTGADMFYGLAYEAIFDSMIRNVYNKNLPSTSAKRI